MFWTVELRVARNKSRLQLITSWCIVRSVHTLFKLRFCEWEIVYIYKYSEHNKWYAPLRLFHNKKHIIPNVINTTAKVPKTLATTITATFGGSSHWAKVPPKTQQSTATKSTHRQPLMLRVMSKNFRCDRWNLKNKYLKCYDFTS